MAADYLLDEMERALHDSLCVIKRTLESGSVVPGGGAVETALSIYLENFATTLVSPSCTLDNVRCPRTPLLRAGPRRLETRANATATATPSPAFAFENPTRARANNWPSPNLPPPSW